MSIERSISRYIAAGAVVARDDRVLVLRRPSRSELRLPKGHVEPGESVLAAALRETREESGYDGLLLQADLGIQLVDFEWDGRRILRTEWYFLMTLADPDAPPSEAEGQFEPLWLTWEEARAALTYDAEREWVRRAFLTTKEIL